MTDHSREQVLDRMGQYVVPYQTDDLTEPYNSTIQRGSIRTEYALYGREPWLARLDRARHRIPFWWWLTYDALVGLVIVVGISPSDLAYWVGLGVLAIAVAIDAVEFVVKRPRTPHGRSRRDGPRP